MPIARKHLYDPTHGPWIHAISRCVRRAHLCGGSSYGQVITSRNPTGS